ncbi:DksA/TraR family C4-type zinc finger protein [Shimwellia pseudoproteus]|uniref:DksA/TraR family C4-type zinc finger protein n=1 Tax=Shimwellia pseudoproteus TaxID=570012 RepID=UPI0018EACF75|nr:DksA/TraR family C4-type zinc finger protein [Shimwellia pseudoproteus]MBJ3813655.1 DksA/TraR family C4-type zinc finger protein [Shimwellia pseudoproteus]
MAVGWAGDGAEQDQINSTIEDGIARARSALPAGESLMECEVCGEVIPEGRRKAIPGVRRCVRCQSQADQHAAAFSGYNRRGSKDSQLR